MVPLSQNHPQGEEREEQPVAQVSEHHRKQEGEGDDGVWSCQSHAGMRDAGL